MRKRYRKRAPKKSSALPIRLSVPDVPNSILSQVNFPIHSYPEMNHASRVQCTRLAFFFGPNRTVRRRSSVSISRANGNANCPIFLGVISLQTSDNGPLFGYSFAVTQTYRAELYATPFDPDERSSREH